MMFKRKKNMIILAVLLVIFVLEILPYGAVLNFADDGDKVLKQTYSYFDLIPYGYANFGPFITAILTCVLILMNVVNLFIGGKKMQSAIKILMCAALITSLFPLMISSYSVLGGIISGLLFVAFLISLKKEKSV